MRDEVPTPGEEKRMLAYLKALLLSGSQPRERTSFEFVVLREALDNGRKQA